MSTMNVAAEMDLAGEIRELERDLKKANARIAELEALLLADPDPSYINQLHQMAVDYLNKYAVAQSTIKRLDAEIDALKAKLDGRDALLQAQARQMGQMAEVLDPKPSPLNSYEAYGYDVLVNRPPHLIGYDILKPDPKPHLPGFVVGDDRYIGTPVSGPESLWHDSGSLQSGPPPETPLHIKWTNFSDHEPSHKAEPMIDPSWAAQTNNTLLVTASALLSAGTTLEEFQEWIAQWWMLAIKPGLSFPQDEGEIVSPPQE